MALPNNSYVIDSVTNYAIPVNLGTWGNLSGRTWDSWKHWQDLKANSMTVIGTVRDRGVTGWFNLKTDCDVTGNISYSVYTSNSGAFAGEETVSNITPNTGNLSAFYGRYYTVVTTVTDPSGEIELRRLDITDTNSRFDIQFNDVDTSSLVTGSESGTKILPLPRTISAVTNMQVTAHNPTASTTTYMPTGNDGTGYIVNYNGPSTKLSNIVTSSGAVVEYLVAGTSETTNRFKVYKTTDGVNWNFLANLANAAPESGAASHVTFNPDGTRLAIGFIGMANDYNSFRTYTVNGDTFTLRNDPDTWPVGGVRKIEYSPNGSYLAVAHDSSPYITIYSISGNNLNKLTNPTTLPTGLAYDLSWDSTSTYLAVAHVSSPFLSIYKRSGNTFTKLANPSILPPATSTGNAIDFHPSGNYLIWGGETSSPVGRPLRLYSRSGDTFSLVTASNANLNMSSGTIYGLQYNSAGTHLAIGSTGTPSFIYTQSGNVLANSGVVFGNVTPWRSMYWDSDGDHLFIGDNTTTLNPRGMYIYNAAYSGTGNANVTLTAVTGVTSNVGNVRTAATWTTSYGAYVEVANAAIFSGSGGNIRINNETLSYVSANTAVTPNRLEFITRGVTTTEFGTSTANIHSINSEVFPIEQLDFTARYFASQTVSMSHAFIADKDRVNPTVIVRDSEGNNANSTIDALIWALPEQYMDDTNLGTR